MSDLRQAFPGQGKDEAVFIFLRRYYIAFMPFVSLGVIMLVVCLAIFYTAYQQSTTSSIVYNSLIAFGGSFGLFTVLFIAVAWMSFYFDINIVTDRRIVDINQNGLFSRDVSELSLEDVEDVSVQFSGMMPTLFNYGDIMIQTAGTKNNFTFLNIRNPRDVASIIVDLSEQSKRGIPQGERFPSTPVVGVINDQPLTSRQGLIKEGGLPIDGAKDE